MKIKYLFWSIVTVIVIYFVASFLLFYKNFSPKIDSIFENLNNLEFKQELTDTIFQLKKTENNEIYLLNLNIRDTVEIHFLNCDFKSFSESTKFKKYIIMKDNTCKKAPSDSYILNNNGIPLKYNKIIFPYSLRIYNGKIIKTSFEYFENE